MLHHLVFFTYVFSLFRFIKRFLIVFYFTNSLFNRKSIYKLIQESIKISKVSYFFQF